MMDRERQEKNLQEVFETAQASYRAAIEIYKRSERFSAAPLKLADLRSSRGDRRRDLYSQITV